MTPSREAFAAYLQLEEPALILLSSREERRDGYILEQLSFDLGTGTPVRGLLTRPLAAGRYPAILYAHSHGDRYDIGAGTTQLPDVNLLMESNGLGISAENPLTNLVPLGNDEYGTRQFLYPQLLAVNNVPEPGSLVLVGGALAVLWAATRRRRQG